MTTEFAFSHTQGARMSVLVEYASTEGSCDCLQTSVYPTIPQMSRGNSYTAMRTPLHLAHSWTQPCTLVQLDRFCLTELVDDRAEIVPGVEHQADRFR